MRRRTSCVSWNDLSICATLEWVPNVEIYNRSTASATTPVPGGSSALSTLGDIYYQRAINKVVVFSPIGTPRTCTLGIGTECLAHLVSEAVLEACESELRT